MKPVIPMVDVPLEEQRNCTAAQIVQPNAFQEK